LAPFIVHRLGNQEYGVWSLVGSVTRYLWLLDMGVRGATTRYVARHHARLEHQEASAFGPAALVTFSALACVVLVVGFILALIMGSVFPLPTELVPSAR